MKARPILFSAPMVRALLDGRKTQTRRALKHQPLDVLPMEGEHAGRSWITLDERSPEPKGKVVRCRFGVAGDLLWVRETWREDSPDDPESAIYRADREQAMPIGRRWKPSIHMSRWASRLTLRLTDVRVERLQDISEEDALAEGIREENIITGVSCYGGMPVEHSASRYFYDDREGEGYESAAEAFGDLWSGINGADSWNGNPWVWALTFTVEKRNVDEVLRAAA